jgi:hypothetical protein
MKRACLTLAALAAGVGLPAATAHAADDDASSDIILLDPGDQSNAITLPPAPVVGQRAQLSMSMHMDMTIEGGGMSQDAVVGLTIVVTSEVTEVLPDGGYVTLTSLDSVEVAELPEGASASDMPCSGVLGLEFHQTFDAAGSVQSTEIADDTGLDPAEQACVEQWSSSQSQATVVYPDGAVGPGAQWTGEVVTENQGMAIPVTYTYTLTDVTEGRFTIETSIDSDFEYDDGSATGTGTMTGSGTSIGSADNPLDVAGTIQMAMTLDASAGGQQFSMVLDMAVDITSSQPAP